MPRSTRTRSWSREEIDDIQTSLASAVESAVGFVARGKSFKGTISRHTPRTVLVRVEGEPELVFEITVRRMY